MTIEAMRANEVYGGLRTREGVAVALEGVAIEGEVLGGHAHVRVRAERARRRARRRRSRACTRFRCRATGRSRAFAWSATAAWSKELWKEREQAFRAYDDAVIAGHGAALLEQEHNVFTASVGNLLPASALSSRSSTCSACSSTRARCA